MDYPPLICGIDPGASGGIAVIGESFAEAHKMPETETDIFEVLAGYRNTEFQSAILKIYIEAVHAFPGQGVVSMFAFGRNYGFLRGLITALRIPFEEVAPQRWKKALGLRFTKDDSLRDKKNGSKQLAQQLFPLLTITHGVSEALLIAEYGRRHVSN